LRQVRTLGCDRVISIGDSIAIGPFPSETLHLLQTEGVQMITGNHEEYLLNGFPTPRSGINSLEEIEHQRWTREQVSAATIDLVREWQYETREDTQGKRIRFLHFAYDEVGILAKSSLRSDSELAELFGTKDDLVVFGHTHLPLDVQLKSRYINPGSLGCGRDYFARYITIDVCDSQFNISWHEVPYNKQDLIDSFLQRSVPAKEEIFRIFYGIQT
jgi:predicted phosphodiesterase